MRAYTPLFCLLVPLSLAASAPGAPTPDLRGVYFHEFDGSFSGTEWFQVFALEADDRVHMGDINAGGAWGATINGDVFTLDSGAGAGVIHGPDAFEIDFTLGAFNFHSDMVRAPFTTTEFPVRLESPISAPEHIAGAWTGARREIHPMTGDELSHQSVNVSVTTPGTTIVTPLDATTIVIGVWETPVLAAYRVVVPNALDPRYQTFPGSVITLNQNMLGELRVTDRNSMEMTLLLQSRAAVGFQTQSLTRVELQRQTPLALGDVNADGAVDASDATALDALLGLSDEDDAYSILADLDVDGDIDASDGARLASILAGCIADLAPPYGEHDFADVLAFLGAFGAGAPEADLAAPSGTLDFADVLAFLGAFGAGCA